MEKFLDETIQTIKHSKDRNFEKNYYYKFENFTFNVELREMDRILFFSYIGEKRAVFLYYDRDKKEFKNDNKDFVIEGNGMDCIGFIPFKPIFEKMEKIDGAINQSNRVELEIVYEKGELEMLGLIGDNNETLKLAEESNLYLHELYHLKREVNQQNGLKEEIKTAIFEKVDYLISFFKKNEQFSQEREHNLKRLVREDFPNLIDSFLKLEDELKVEEEQSFLEAIEMIHEATKEEIKELTLSSFRKNLTLFKKRYS